MYTWGEWGWQALASFFNDIRSAILWYEVRPWANKILRHNLDLENRYKVYVTGSASIVNMKLFYSMVLDVDWAHNVSCGKDLSYTATLTYLSNVDMRKY